MMVGMVVLEKWYNKYIALHRGGCTLMWETVFAVVCFGIVVLNIGYCLFDNEK